MAGRSSLFLSLLKENYLAVHVVFTHWYLIFSWGMYWG